MERGPEQNSLYVKPGEAAAAPSAWLSFTETFPPLINYFLSVSDDSASIFCVATVFLRWQRLALAFVLLILVFAAMLWILHHL